MANLADITTHDIVSPVDFRRAMREVAAGVTIISSGSVSAARGLTATAFSSLSAEPAAVLVCVNRDSECHATILETGAFCVNILKSDSEALAHRFAGRDGVKGSDRFLCGTWTTMVTGAPVLSESLAAFDCRLRDAIVSGTHSIFIGDVMAASVGTPGPALVYRAGSFCGVK